MFKTPHKMKKILLLSTASSLLLFSAIGSDAKTRAQHTPGNRPTLAVQCPIKNKSLAFSIAKKQQDALFAQKNSAERTASYPSERLIATSNYNEDYTDTPNYPAGIVDSAYYAYTGQRGSIFDANSLSFMSPSANIFATGNSINNYLSGTTLQFTPNVNTASVLADTTLLWNSNNTNTSGNNYFDYNEYVHDIYDANNNVISCTDSNDNTNAFQWDSVINVYGSDGNIASSLDLQWSGFAWDSNTYVFFYYNTAGELVKDSTATYTGTWGPTNLDAYYYNSHGYVIHVDDSAYNTGAWVDQVHVNFGYNSENELKFDTVSVNTGSAWINYEIDTFGYVTGADYWTALYSNFAYGAQWETEIETKHVNSSFMPDSFSVMVTGSNSSYTNNYVYAEKVAYNYDSYNNPTTDRQYYYTVTDMTVGTGYYDTTADEIDHYYYQNYIAAAVAKVNAPTPTVTVYPNPASNILNVTITDITSGANTSLRLTNIIGQTVISKTLPWTAATQSLPLTGIAPGIYILQVQDDKGNTLSTQKVIKQ